MGNALQKCLLISHLDNVNIVFLLAKLAKIFQSVFHAFQVIIYQSAIHHHARSVPTFAHPVKMTEETVLLVKKATIFSTIFATDAPMPA